MSMRRQEQQNKQHELDRALKEHQQRVTLYRSNNVLRLRTAGMMLLCLCMLCDVIEDVFVSVM